jgi:hypothetical protein
LPVPLAIQRKWVPSLFGVRTAQRF